MSDLAHAPYNTKKFLGHPVGLYILFFTEMWERFSYYGMRAILVLFLTSKTNGGLSWTDAEALKLYGWYTMLVYVASIPGGYIADKFLGQKRSVMLGGFLLVAGHLLMAYTALWAFYGALALIVIGVGFLKPNISSMVGGLYKQGDQKRDSGFIIFYIGINVGAFLSSLIVGYVGENIGWHYGFALAGFGMLLGQFVYISGQKHLKHVGNLLKSSSSEGDETPKKPFTKQEKDRIKVILISFLIVLVFWAAFEQAGGFMNLYTKDYTDRFIAEDIRVNEYATHDLEAESKVAIEEVQSIVESKAHFEINSFESFYKNLVSPTPKSFAEINDSIKALNLSPYIDSRIYEVEKATIDSALYANLTSESPEIVKQDGKYVISDLNNDQSGFMVPTSWFQSLNALFIIIFGGVFSVVWAFLAKRGKEPNTMFKFGISTIILSVGFLFMVFASVEKSSSYLGKSSMIWLVGAYLFHTLGELCISPIALSFITKVAPKRIVASMMGIYFAVTGFGNKLAGIIGEQAAQFGDFSVFLGITIFSAFFGLILLLFAKPLMRLTHGTEQTGKDVHGEVIDE